METTTTDEMDEAQGFEHGLLDATDHAYDARHLAEDNTDAWEWATDAYRRGYEAGWTEGQPDIDTSRPG